MDVQRADAGDRDGWAGRMRGYHFLGYALATGLRVWMLMDGSLREGIASRVEVSTPVTSFTRIKEGAYLWQHGASPYSGDVLHQPPFVLFFCEVAALTAGNFIFVPAAHPLAHVSAAVPWCPKKCMSWPHQLTPPAPPSLSLRGSRRAHVEGFRLYSFAAHVRLCSEVYRGRVW